MNERLRVLAEQAGFVTSHRRVGGIGWIWVSDGYPIDNQLERFAALVRNDATELAKQTALDKKADNARELGLDYEPEQEPVAWVGLTDEQLSEIYNDLYTQYTRDDVNIADFILIARAIEAKLKEKNT
jgi:hypothetical protein